MPKFLFWNTGKNSIGSLIQTLAVERDIDLLIIAELVTPPLELQGILNETDPVYRYIPGLCPLLYFFGKFDPAFLSPLKETQRYSMRLLKMPGRDEIIVVGVHLPSQMHAAQTDIAYLCGRLARQIVIQEDLLGHTRTMVIGDFNLNPFHDGLVAADSLHASMSRHVALRQTRVVQQESFRFFYNPMWAYFHDRDSITAGTFFYAKAQQVNYFWNAFDQVLLRPYFLRHFTHEKLEVVRSIGLTSLVDDEGLPDAITASDHLPLYIDLDF